MICALQCHACAAPPKYDLLSALILVGGNNIVHQHADLTVLRVVANTVQDERPPAVAASCKLRNQSRRAQLIVCDVPQRLDMANPSHTKPSISAYRITCNAKDALPAKYIGPSIRVRLYVSDVDWLYTDLNT